MSATPSTTSRGLSLWMIENVDYDERMPYEISVQESSIATERKIWVGPDDNSQREEYMRGDRMHLTEQAARDLRDALTQWLEGGR